VPETEQYNKRRSGPVCNTYGTRKARQYRHRRKCCDPSELTQIITVFARSLGGVDFESLDQKPVHFVCMVIAPAHSTGQHLKALARISRLFKNQTLREGILKSEDSNAIYSILLEEDSKFI